MEGRRGIPRRSIHPRTEAPARQGLFLHCSCRFSLPCLTFDPTDPKSHPKPRRFPRDSGPGSHVLCGRRGGLLKTPQTNTAPLLSAVSTFGLRSLKGCLGLWAIKQEPQSALLVGGRATRECLLLALCGCLCALRLVLLLPANRSQFRVPGGRFILLPFTFAFLVDCRVSWLVRVRTWGTTRGTAGVRLAVGVRPPADFREWGTYGWGTGGF